MNKVFISGNLCKDLEVRTAKDNDKACNFTLAVYRDKETAEFIQCSAYGRPAETMEKYCNTKGQKCYIVGRISTRNYDDKDGKKVYVTEVKVESVEPVFTEREEKVTDDDLPF